MYHGTEPLAYIYCFYFKLLPTNFIHQSALTQQKESEELNQSHKSKVRMALI